MRPAVFLHSFHSLWNDVTPFNPASLQHRSPIVILYGNEKRADNKAVRRLD